MAGKNTFSTAGISASALSLDGTVTAVMWMAVEKMVESILGEAKLGHCDGSLCSLSRSSHREQRILPNISHGLEVGCLGIFAMGIIPTVEGQQNKYHTSMA